MLLRINNMKYSHIFFIFVGLLFGFIYLANLPQAEARVSGVCFDCHTMHNSQGGDPVNLDGPEANLLKDDCIGCHSSTTSSTIIDGVPIVWNQAAPVNPLAGGNFFWIANTGNSELGHNVLGISTPDDNLAIAPGGVAYGVNCRCHYSLADSGPLGWPGLKNGCTGCHIRPAHHADDTLSTLVGEAGGWYRFLGDHQGGGWSVQGIEDSDWEQTISDADHNEYMGASDSNYSHAVSRWCAGCHYDFHEVNGTNYQGGVWFRHPVNTALPGLGEYTAYTAYPATGPVVPVARPDLDSFGGPSAVVRPGIDQVFCLSCHRAHGSPYPNMLRWDYSAIIAGDGENDAGCFACHSEKDTL